MDLSGVWEIVGQRLPEKTVLHSPCAYLDNDSCPMTLRLSWEHHVTNVRLLEEVRSTL